MTCDFSIYYKRSNCSYLINIEIFSKKGALLRGRLSAIIGQDLFEGYYSVVWLAKCEGLTADCEVDMVFCQRPAPLLVHLHGLAVTAQCMPPLHVETEERARDRRKKCVWGKPRKIKKEENNKCDVHLVSTLDMTHNGLLKTQFNYYLFSTSSN